MTTDAVIHLGQRALQLMVLVSLPPVLAGLVAGLVSSVLQSVTQVQETSLSTVPRLAAALATLVVVGPWASAQLQRFVAEVLTAMPGVAR